MCVCYSSRRRAVTGHGEGPVFLKLLGLCRLYFADRFLSPGNGVNTGLIMDDNGATDCDS